MIEDLNLEKVAARFWTHVDKSGSCWLWIGAQARGYGILSSRHGKAPLRAHRVSLVLSGVKVFPSDKVLHSCDVKACVRPEHLRVGTQKENIREASARGRLNPKSLRNLQPGAPGYHGAGPKEAK